MARQTIELGVIPDGAGGDTDRQAHDKSNSNATELYLFLGDGTNLIAGTARQNIGALGEDDVYSMPEIDNFLSKKADLVSGLVPSSQLPSYVDDVIESDDFASLPATGEQGKIYVTIDNNKIYRWSGTTYIEIVGGAGGVADSALKLQTARNINSVPFDGTQDITIPKANIGLGNVDNTSDLNKPISTATQTALDAKADLDAVKRGIGNVYDSSLSYNINERVLLDDGTEVISTIPSNTNDPNVDMTGWVNVSNEIVVNSVADMLSIPNPFDGLLISVKSYNTPNYALKLPFSGGGEFVYDSSKSSVNDGGIVINGYVRVYDNNSVHVDWFGADPNGILDSTNSIINAIKYFTGGSINGNWNSSKYILGTVDFGAGLYIAGDIPLVSCLQYRGQGKYATQIIPNSTATWVFNTFGTTEVNGVITTDRLIYTKVCDMTIGYGYFQAKPIENTACGGINNVCSSWCRFDNLLLAGIGGKALQLIGVMDNDFDDVTIFSTGANTNSASLTIDRYPNSGDGSNANTFRRLHIEGVYKWFDISTNSRHIYFLWSKFEVQTVPSTIKDTLGIIFSDLEISAMGRGSDFSIVVSSTGVYSPSPIEFNNPVLIDNGDGNFIQNLNPNTKIRIKNPTCRNMRTLAKGFNFKITGLYAFDCASPLLDLATSKVSDAEIVSQKSETIADGSKDTIICGVGVSIKDSDFTSQGTNTNNIAFINKNGNTPKITGCNFGSGNQYAIRGDVAENIYDNTYTNTPFSGYTVLYNTLLNNGQKLGFGAGGSTFGNVSVSSNATESVSNVVNGASLLLVRSGSQLNAVVFSDASSNTVLVSKNGTLDCAIGTGIASDGKVYFRNSGSSLVIENRSASPLSFFITSLSAVQ